MNKLLAKDLQSNHTQLDLEILQEKTVMAQYDYTEQYTTKSTANGDPTDIYYPVADSTANPAKFPMVLLLQGALVDKADYSNFATQVASYGFIVVVPNHERTGTLPKGQTVTGLLREQQQVNDVLV